MRKPGLCSKYLREPSSPVLVMTFLKPETTYHINLFVVKSGLGRIYSSMFVKVKYMRFLSPNIFPMSSGHLVSTNFFYYSSVV